MRVIESFICGKENNPVTCEDGIFISDNLVVVIDGVTAKGNRLWDGHKSGCFAKDLLLDYLRRSIEKCDEDFAFAELGAVTLLAKLDAVLHDEVAARCGNDLPAEEYPRASIIIYNDATKEVISYGDCQCRINDEVHSHVKKIDVLNSDLRAYYLEYHLLQGMTLAELAENDLGRAAIQENLLMQFAFENKCGEFGYPVLNGMGIEPSLIKIYKVLPGDEVILASDGYPILGSSLEESEEMLQQVLQEDPMCFRKYRSTKGIKAGNVSFDDRVFCRIIV